MESNAIVHQTTIVKKRLQLHAQELRRAARREVLGEDEFVDKLDSIIQRDFYPELPRLRSQLELLEALDAGDTERARRAFAQIAPPGATPAAVGPADRGRGGQWTPGSVSDWGGGTPREEERGAGSGTPRVNAATGSARRAAAAAAAAPPEELPRLDRFLSAATSEDNASFAVVLGKEQAERKRKLWWMQDGSGAGGAAALKMHSQRALTLRGEAPAPDGSLLGMGPGGAGGGARAGWACAADGSGSTRPGGDGAARAAAAASQPLLGLRGAGGAHVGGAVDSTAADCADGGDGGVRALAAPLQLGEEEGGLPLRRLAGPPVSASPGGQMAPPPLPAAAVEGGGYWVTSSLGSWAKSVAAGGDDGAGGGGALVAAPGGGVVVAAGGTGGTEEADGTPHPSPEPKPSPSPNPSPSASRSPNPSPNLTPTLTLTLTLTLTRHAPPVRHRARGRARVAQAGLPRPRRPADEPQLQPLLARSCRLTRVGAHTCQGLAGTLLASRPVGRGACKYPLINTPQAHE